MAIRFDAVATKYLSRTTNVLDYTGTYTLMAWVYVVATTGANATFWVIDNGTSNQRDQVRYTSAAALSTNVNNGGTNGSTLSTATWYHIAAVRESNTSFKVYLNGALDITNTTNITGRTTTSMRLFVAQRGGGEGGNYRLYGVKAWSRSLTIDEVKSEINVLRPADTANLYGWWPIFPGSGERVRDYSGNAYDFTENGTLPSEEDPAPVSYGARAIWSPYAAVSAITGDAALTQSGQTLSAAGSVAVSGASALTQAGQTLSAAGAVEISGAVTLTQAAHTSSASGAVDIAGSASLTQAAHTLTADGILGTTDITGDAALTQAGQTLAAAGVANISGSAALSQAGSTLGAAGVIYISGSASLEQAWGEVTASGAVDISGTAALTQAANVISGDMSADIAGAGSLIQADQTISASGIATILSFVSLSGPARDYSLSGPAREYALTAPARRV